MRKKLSRAAMIVTLFVSHQVFACEITVAPDKEQYIIGDVATLGVELLDTHRNCTFQGKEPKIKISGLEIVAKTKYKEKSSGLWTIKFKVKVLEEKNQFTVLRDNCSSGGGVKAITLKVKAAETKALEPVK